MRSIIFLFSLLSNIFIVCNSDATLSNNLSYETHLTNLDVEEACNVLSENDCHSNDECSWCSSGAVKSQCHSLENASRLPSSIFLCSELNQEKKDVVEADFYDDLFGGVDAIEGVKYVEFDWHPRWVDFVEFIQSFNKKYNTNEIEKRFDNFLKNLEIIENHSFSFELGINSYSDLSQEEFQEFVREGGYVHHIKEEEELTKTMKRGLRWGRTSCSSFRTKVSPSSLPGAIDWREKGAVTDVKDQGNCGSCWSFSATGSMEGAWAIKNDKLVSFSEQQLIDCSALYGNSGCSGGLMESAFEYAIDKGACAEGELPYKAVGGDCSLNCNKVAHFTGCVDVTQKNQLHLKEAVSYGPVSVAIEADTLVFQFYKSGVVDDVKCGVNLDHGVLVVGYGNENGKDYWIVKNSWGPGWGEKGFVKIARSNSTSDAGICGIALQPSYIVV